MTLYFRGRLLYALRAKNGWSIIELARRSGVDRGTIMRLEQGKVKKRPKAETIAKIAKAFDVSEIMFIGGGEK